MRRRAMTGMLAIGGAATGWAVRHAYRQALAAAVAATETGAQYLDTPFGRQEFAREGAGPPVLVSHGAGGGFDQGLLVGRELMGPAHTLIAPSRFGYLGSALPAAHQPADQADAYAALLDHLGLGRVVCVGISAGAPSIVELALRHPEHVAMIILVVPRLPAPGSEVAPERTPANALLMAAAQTGADFLWWTIARLAPGLTHRFLGVPPAVANAADPPDRARLDAIVRSILPLSRRCAGIVADGDAQLGGWPLARIAVPTLLVSAADDLFNTLPAARFTADAIPGAEIEVLESGGHLLVGRRAQVRARIADFVRRHRPAGAPATGARTRPRSRATAGSAA